MPAQFQAYYASKSIKHYANIIGQFSRILMKMQCARQQCCTTSTHRKLLLHFISKTLWCYYFHCFLTDYSHFMEIRSRYSNRAVTYFNTAVRKCKSNPKQPSGKKECGPQKGYGEKRCEIQGGGREMAVMVG